MKMFCKGRGLYVTKKLSELSGVDRVKEYVGKRSGRTIYKTTNSESGKKEYSREFVVTARTINWATTHQEFDGIVYNTVDAVKAASDKAGARIALLSAGLSAPKTVRVTDYHNGDLTFPIVARPPYHYGGKGFTFIETEADYITLKENGTIKDNWYLSEYFNKNKEYRVHVAHGKILAVQGKVREDGQNAEDFRVWNHCESGFRFRPIPWSECSKELVTLAIKACDTIGLDFAAIDIMAKETSEECSYSVCELNTSPGIKTYMLNKYAEYFKWLSKSETRREHFPIPRRGTVMSFFWKEDDFNG